MAEQFRIEIVASARQAQAGIAAIDSSLAQLNRTAASTNSLLKGALQVAGIGSVVLLVQRAAAALTEYADGFIQLQNQLKVVTKDSRDLAVVTDALLGVANRSRTGFEETAKLYARTALATRELGTSQADLIGITESVNKAIILSGAGAKEANNGLIQLSQAIASNRLAGDELRSVLEQLPVVADVIAKQLRVTRGELRLLGQEGKITAAVILEGFKNARAEIEEKFSRTVPTISQSFEVLRNSLVNTIGQLNSATSATAGFSEVLLQLSKLIEFLGRSAKLLGEATSGVNLLTGELAALALGLGSVAATNPFVAIALAAGGLIITIASLSKEFDLFFQKLQKEEEALSFNKVGDQLQKTAFQIDQLEAKIAAGVGGPTASALLDRLREKFARLSEESRKAVQGAARQAVDPTKEVFEKRIALIDAETVALGKARRERELDIDVLREQARLENSLKRELSPDEATKLRTSVAARSNTAETAKLTDSIREPAAELRRSLALIAQLEKEGTISTDEFTGAFNGLFDQLRKLTPLQAKLEDLRQEFKQLAKTPAELLARAGKASAGTDAAAQLKDLQDANRERAVQAELQNQINSARAQGRSDTEIEAGKGALEIQIRANAEQERTNGLTEQQLQLQRDLADQQKLALLPGFERSIQQQVLAQHDLTETQKEALEPSIRQTAALSDLGQLLNSLQEPSLALAQKQAEVARQQQEANDQFANGALNIQQYSTLIQELNFRAAQLSTTFTDGLVVALKQMSASLSEATIGQTLLTGAVEAAGSASAEFVQTGTVDFRKYALNIIAEISKIITQLLVLRAIQGISSAFGGGLGADFIGPRLPGTAAGGPVEADLPRIVGERGPELFFPGASGVVVPNDQVVSALAESGRGGQTTVVTPPPAVNVSIVNRTDPNEALDAMDTPAGARVIQNQISRNPAATRRSLGG